jgi:MFS family permease
MHLVSIALLYYLISFFLACLFISPIWTFFFTSYHNFSFSSAVFLTVLTGIANFIFEIPSGSWADRFGRKRIYILGVVLMII